jgi:hypothetical protein
MTHEPNYSTTRMKMTDFALPVIHYRDNPFRIVQTICEHIGARPATSIAEAQTASYMAKYLRRAGLTVWTDPFMAPIPSGGDAILIALLATAVIVLWPTSQAYAISAAVLCVITALIAGSSFFSWLTLRRAESQNVIGTLASVHPPTRRVVLLTPLDTHRPPDPLFGREVRLGASIALLTLVTIEYIAPLPLAGQIRIGIMAIPTIYLIMAASTELWSYTQAHSVGAVSYASAIASMLTAVDDVGRLQHTEIWVVGVGSGTTGAGVRHLLKQYPFDSEGTFFIGIEGIGRGALSYIIRDYKNRFQTADPTLVQRVIEATTGVRAEPSIAGFTTVVDPILKAKRRAISIATLDQKGRVPLQGSPKDTPEAVNPALLEQATRLIANTMRNLEH